MAGLTCGHWLANAPQVCSLTLQPQTLISLTRAARWGCWNQPPHRHTHTHTLYSGTSTVSCSTSVALCGTSTDLQYYVVYLQYYVLHLQYEAVLFAYLLAVYLPICLLFICLFACCLSAYLLIFLIAIKTVNSVAIWLFSFNCDISDIYIVLLHIPLGIASFSFHCTSCMCMWQFNLLNLESWIWTTLCSI